jgi:PAS domain S-box-containing protein
LVSRLDGTVAWEADPDTLHFLWVSEGAGALLGFPRSDWTAGADFWIERIHPDDRGPATSARKLAIRRRQDHEMEYRMLAADGRTLWVRDRATFGADAGAATLHGMMLDITAEKAASEQLRAQLAQQGQQAQGIYILADAVARAGIDEIYERAIDAIEISLNVDRASLLLFDKDRVMRFKASRGLSEEYRAAVEGHSPWSPDEKNAEPIAIADVATEPGLEELRSVILEEGIRALAFVPLAYQGALLGKFMLYYNAPHEFGADELRLAQTIADHIAFAISRKQNEELLRLAEERYRGIFENAVFGAYQTTPDGRFLAANDALARILGYDSAADLIEGVTDIAHQVHVDPERRDELRRLLQEDGAVHNFEAQAYRKDGTIIWISLSARALHDEDGAVLGFEGILEDVTPRKLAERAVTENEQRYRTIFENAGVSLWDEDFTAVWEMISGLRRRGVKDLRKYLKSHPEFVDKAIAAVAIRDVNEHSVKLYGARDKTELLESLSKVFLPETNDVFIEELVALEKGERFFESEATVGTIDGRRLRVLFTMVFPDDPSALDHVMVSVTDITDRKRAEEQQQFLAEASSILSSTLEYEMTLENLSRLVAGRLGNLCSIDLVDGGSVHRMAVAHVDPAKEALLAGMPPVYHPASDRHPVLLATRNRQSALINGVTDDVLRDSARDDSHLRALKALQISSAMVVPLSVGTRALGAITIVSSDPARTYDESDLALAEELSRRAGMAIDNAELYRAREVAREAAEEAARLQMFLSEASAILASSLEYQATLNSLAQLCVPQLADWCVIDVRKEDGDFERVAFIHSDPNRVEFARRMQEQYPPDYEHGIISQVVKSGESVLYPEIPEEVIAASARDEVHLAMVKELNVKSAIMVPLTARGRALGILTLLTAESGRRYGESELKLAEELGRRSGLALDNARLYDAAEDSRRRQAFLAESSAILSSSLDHQATLAQVADLCVPQIADWCAIDILGEGGGIDHVAIVHRDPEKSEVGRKLRERYPTNYEGGIAKQVLSGKSFFWREIDDGLLAQTSQDEQHLAMLRQLGLKSAIIVPLIARGRTLGILSLVMAQSGRHYEQDDFNLAQEVARRAAIAIDNARLFSAEQGSRAEAEEAQQRLWFLAEANAVLSSSLDYDATFSRVASLAVPWLADCCVAHLFPVDGSEARSAISHVDPSKEPLVHELHAHYAPRPGEPHPILELIHSQAPVLLEEIDESALEDIIQDERHREILQQLSFRSYMAAPLVARGRLFGALTFASSSQSRRYTKQDLSLAEELGRRAALALDNARLYEESQRIQDALRIALEAKDEFLGVMSHELRTPITAIYGGARVLRSRAERLDGESKDRLMEDIEQESERLFRMVENLLVLSRLELGQEVSTEPVLVQRLLSKVTASFKQRRPGRPITVSAPDDLEPVAAEPHYVEQILRNLLSNADKYSPPDAPIELRAARSEDAVEVSIYDRGPGIAPEEIDLIFDRFYRSDQTARQATGIGLGLTVCKRLVEAQAGRIWARPREGGGLAVGINLPLCKEAENDV